MSLRKNVPSFNLKVVVNNTGIKPDTLRAWERRYGLPKPKRTAGGHRLYSQKDIEIIQWLSARQNEGLSISRAVKLWHRLEKEGKDPLKEPSYRLASQKSLPTPQPNRQIDLSETRLAWIQACLNFDESTAERILTQAFALYPTETVCIEVLQKGMSDIGERWYNDQATVQQEHFASALAMRRLNTLVSAAPAPTLSGKIIVACPPHEHHTFASLLLTLMLRHRGWEVLYLGADVPAERFGMTIETARPNLVVLTAQRLQTVASLLDVFTFIDEEETAVAYGGRIFALLPEIQSRIAGHYLGDNLQTATNTIEEIITFQPKANPVTPLPDEYAKALQVYIAHQAQIEMRIWEMLKNSEVSYKQLNEANTFLASDIVAALRLGNMKLLTSQIEWTEKLLLNHQIPVSILQRYLQTYAHITEELLQEDGRLITNWLKSLDTPT